MIDETEKALCSNSILSFHFYHYLYHIKILYHVLTYFISFKFIITFVSYQILYISPTKTYQLPYTEDETDPAYDAYDSIEEKYPESAVLFVLLLKQKLEV